MLKVNPLVLGVAGASVLVLLLSVQSCRLERSEAATKEARTEAAQYKAAYEGNAKAIIKLQDELKLQNKILVEREQERNATQTELLKTKKQVASLLSRQNNLDWHNQPVPDDFLQLLQPDSAGSGEGNAPGKPDAARTSTGNARQD